MRRHHRSRLIVGLDADEKLHLAGLRPPPPQRARAERRLAPPRHEHDVAAVSNPVAGHVVGLRIGHDGLGVATLQVVDPEVEVPVALRGEEDPRPVGGPARPEIQERATRELPRLSGCHVHHVNVEVAVDVRRIGDVASAGRPGRLGMVPGTGGHLSRRPALDRHDPDPPLVGERERLAVGRPRRIGGRRGDGGREVALHVHPAGAAGSGERRISAREGVGIFVPLLCGGGVGEEEGCEGQGEEAEGGGEARGGGGRSLHGNLHFVGHGGSVSGMSSAW